MNIAKISEIGGYYKIMRVLKSKILTESSLEIANAALFEILGRISH